jgi:EAL domain-containing protein (putative c-di-GMP-specific phosphodiesterase class I)
VHYPHDARNVDELFKYADLAMYQAKAAGKNMLRWFEVGLLRNVEERLNLENELRLAIARGQLSLAYQPVWSLDRTRLIGCEALMRWQHSRLGQVPPSLFIPVAEESDLICRLGEWALHEASAAMARLRTSLPREFYCSVNVSLKQLRRQDVGQVIRQALERFDVSTDRIHVEITESTLFDNNGHSVTQLNDLKALGIRLWLDDFGTGFSGLGQLRKMPVYGVKIDKSFITDMRSDPDDLRIVEAIIAMAQSLKLKVTAEGVEYEEEAELLRSRFCDNVQGYLYGRPVPESELFALLMQSRANQPLNANSLHEP